MAGRNEWNDVERQILEALDIQREYESFGVKFVIRPPTQNGWKDCHAFGREDKTPSAGVKVAPGRGQGIYKEFSGTGEKIGFFEFAAKHGGKGLDWKEARRHYANQLGIPLPRGAEPKNPIDDLELEDWNETLVFNFCEAKGGIVPSAVREAGGRLGHWPRRAPIQFANQVIAIPAYAHGTSDDEPCAWVVMNQSAGDVHVFQGRGKPPAKRKVHTLAGSHGGLMNAYAIDHMAVAEVVWKCEGVSDMLALHGIVPDDLKKKHVVITNSGGCMEGVRAEWAALLSGKKVYIVHDADKPGQFGAAKWVSSLTGHVTEVRNVNLPYEVAENHGRDIRDFIREGHTFQELLALADACPPTTGPEVLRQAGGGGGDAAAAEVTDETQLLTLLKLDVLGEHTNQAVEVFCGEHKKLTRINNVGRMSYADLLQMCGDRAKENVDDSRDPEMGKFSMTHVRNAIAYQAGKYQLADGAVLGVGCWRLGAEDPRVAIVDEGEAALWDGEKLVVSTSPRAGGRILDFASGKKWCDIERLGIYLARPAEHQEWLNEATALFAKWNWKHDTNPHLVSALVCASWVQTLWPWRPLVGLSGSSDTGKTTFLELIKALFGELTLFVEKPSEAGIRQAVRNTAKVLMLDEFEQDGHRSRVLELLRTSSKGGEVLRGTADQRGMRFGLRHIVWLAAIELGLTREADRNRFCNLDLNRLDDRVRGTFNPPKEAAAYDLGLRLMAVGVRHVNRAIQLFETTKAVKITSVHGRIVECYSVPASLLAAVEGAGPERAEELLREFLDGREVGKQGSKDEADLLQQILSSPVSVSGGRRYSVSQIIAGDQPTPPDGLPKTSIYGDAWMHMEACGVGLTSNKRGRKPTDPLMLHHIFLSPGQVQRFLLRGTRWGDGDIEQLLLRLPGAERVTRRLASALISGVMIPKEVAKTSHKDDDEEEKPAQPSSGPNNTNNNPDIETT